MTGLPIIGLASVLAFLWITGALWAGPAATRPVATQSAASAPAPTEVVILGTLHGSHSSNAKYSVPILRDIIVGTKPSAILMELPPTIGEKPTIQNGRIVERFASNESAAVNQAAESLGVQVIPYDRDGRNEFYRETRYFDRQEKAYSQLQAWAKTLAEKDPECPEALSWQVLYRSAGQAQSQLVEHAGPETINSVLHDSVIRNKSCIQYKLWPRLMAASGQEELAREFAFFAEEWQERNQIMSRNIVEIARRHPGGRLAVVCGGEHRYILRDLLAKTLEITLKEYYELAPSVSAEAPR